MQDPCLHCLCQAGSVSCERLEGGCPSTQCSHPAPQAGECCPTCANCLYERELIHNGNTFHPPGAGPCLQCVCMDGSVSCQEEVCGSITCSHPIIDPQLCCPVCKVCVVEEEEFADGVEWRPDALTCTTCTCVSGEATCRPVSCPHVSCQHPITLPGSCCADCSRCRYHQQDFGDGQEFTDPENPCHTCRCQAGTVLCVLRPCPPLTCSSPERRPGQCCPKCPDCRWGEEGVYIDGQRFANPRSACQECVCVNGSVTCQDRACRSALCSYPLAGSCCLNNCNGCNFAGKEYPNGADFPHPTNQCKDCHCLNGNIQCLARRCHPLLCTNPFLLPGACCPQCPAPPAQCHYSGLHYKHMERFYDPTEPCRSCICANGTVTCQHTPCAPRLCSHPVLQDCCHTCDGCLFEGKEYANGEQFGASGDGCSVCLCQEGSVTCERRPCEVVECPFPGQGPCCRLCEGCSYLGEEYLNAQEFPAPGDGCSRCECSRGFVTCARRPCYSPGCPHPSPSHGDCCPVCEGCLYSGMTMANGQTLPDPADPVCSQCSCRLGSVQCIRRLCAPVTCSHPRLGACHCPQCDGCHYQGQDYTDGVTFPAPTVQCEECHCKAGVVSCVAVRCPVLGCERPVPVPGECCRRCPSGCDYQGSVYTSGSTFTSPSDPCSTCTCLTEVVSCRRERCLQLCTHPLPTTGCCPDCAGCLYQGQEFTNRQTFTAATQPCKQCSCRDGNVVCTQVVCPPLTCAQPLTNLDHCCPHCPVCRYEGEQYQEGLRWISSVNPCHQCVCAAGGEVRCVVVECRVMCGFPVPATGAQCCPLCDGCYFEGSEFTNGEAFSPDPCRACTCNAGDVRCVSTQCPRLSCSQQVQEVGSCCPRCRGCVYGGLEQEEGGSWSPAPCVTCTCEDGVTTCSHIRCLTPCLNPIPSPGDCCPRCADCVFEGRVYGPGESFTPNTDPCEICTCEATVGGERRLTCYHRQCGRLVDCPQHLIEAPAPGHCCPHCSQPLSNCTEDLQGHELQATDNPCYTCHCQDLTWTCVHQDCPPLSCPLHQQLTPQGNCCPHCQGCVIEGDRRSVSDGETWTDSTDPCITCTCNVGYIECQVEECEPLLCQAGLPPITDTDTNTHTGNCCPRCPAPVPSCVYQGRVFVSNQHWEVDQCTRCTCVSGEVHCHTDHCTRLLCASDETLAVVPGMCCPHCLPRPATCLAFGDPHYRTFDGKMIHFQGTCSYVLAQDCQGGDFSVQVTNAGRGLVGVAWTQEVTVLVADIHVHLLQDWGVMVDGHTVSLPFLREPYIYIQRKTNSILLNTNIGVKLLWDGRSRLEVSVSGRYRGQTCGLCGNFNNFPQDDLQLRSGLTTTSQAAFGNSWQVADGNETSSDCAEGREVDPCKEAGYRARKEATARCKVLQSAVFRPCHRLVSPEMFFGSCVYDLCACGAVGLPGATGTEGCLCDVLEAYTSECREAGIILNWRSPGLCAVGCPLERGYVFDECGPPCPKTCFNKDVPLGELEGQCLSPCVPGCQCPAGLLEHEAHCIPPHACPTVIHTGH